MNRNILKQIELIERIQNDTNINIVTCGHCDSVLLDEMVEGDIICPFCDTIGESSDFGDYFYRGMEVEKIKKQLDLTDNDQLIEYVKKQELILEEVFLNGDENEVDPNYVLCNSDNTDYPIIFTISVKTNRVRIWTLTEPQNDIAEKYRYEILVSRLGKVTADDEVSIGDIFMHGSYTKELTYNEWAGIVNK